MRKEYDFSHATRGKHAGKRFRVVGDTRMRNGPNTAARIQQTIERDLKNREDFKVIWKELNQDEKKSLRAAWLKKISAILANDPDQPSHLP